MPSKIYIFYLPFSRIINFHSRHLLPLWLKSNVDDFALSYISYNTRDYYGASRLYAWLIRQRSPLAFGFDYRFQEIGSLRRFLAINSIIFTGLDDAAALYRAAQHSLFAGDSFAAIFPYDDFSCRDYTEYLMLTAID